MMKLSTITAQALSVGIIVALWTANWHYGHLPLLLWPVIVGMGCYVAAEEGLPGLQKTLAGLITGVVWALIAYFVSRALGRSNIVEALVYGLVVAGMVLQAQVPLLSYTGAAFVGAGAAIGAAAHSWGGGARTAAALAIGVVLGYAAELGAEKIMEVRKRR
jgi:hypothetical protein